MPFIPLWGMPFIPLKGSQHSPGHPVAILGRSYGGAEAESLQEKNGVEWSGGVLREK